MLENLSNFTSKHPLPGTSLRLSFGSSSLPVSRRNSLHSAGFLLILSDPVLSFVSQTKSRNSKFAI